MAEQTDFADMMQQLIGDELKKYHEEKLRKDRGEEPRPIQGLRY